MADFVSVCKVDDIENPGRAVFEVSGRMVVVIRVDDQVFCLEDECTHDGGTLADGSLDGHSLRCARHGAKFDVRTGKPLSMPATKATEVYKAKIEDDQILVCVDD